MNRRRAARFGAVQALYQAELSGLDIDMVVREFQAYRLDDLLEPVELDDPAPEAAPAQRVDRDWFALLAEGAWQQRNELDPLIEARLAAGWTLARAGYLLRAFLRAGAYELASRPDVPKNVVIHEYVELAHGFLSKDDAGFVNAVLDRLATELRPDEQAPENPAKTSR